MMLITRTPMRISLFGGGTDYPEYFSKRRGAVIGLAIDKYIYIAALRMSGTQNYRYRLAYSQVETVDHADQLQHRAVRAALNHYGIAESLDISIMADMPASSGLGSSSCFAVGMLNLISRLKNERTTKLDLALRAIHLERELIGENVGVQDQMHAAFGGINRFDFDSGSYRITPILLRGDSLQYLLDSLVLVHTGVTRHASQVVASQVARTRDGTIDSSLERLLEIVDEGEEILRQLTGRELTERIGGMLHDSWVVKRTLSPHVSNEAIDALYDQCRNSGAVGGKLCGAGGGGFLLMVIPAEQKNSFVTSMHPHRVISLGLDTVGSAVIHS
jgi:D-glycero-alpha-D-manno-heptose-7-phosphate kinase